MSEFQQHAFFFDTEDKSAKELNDDNGLNTELDIWGVKGYYLSDVKVITSTRLLFILEKYIKGKDEDDLEGGDDDEGGTNLGTFFIGFNPS